MQSYKIGTRGSLLAVTQSTLVKNQLEAFSGDKFELVTIRTQGDEVTNKPLWQLDGKDFFTKELDEALLRGDVDLVIHSYKDLGTVRPHGIKLAAVTERKFAHDILLIPQKHLAHFSSWQGDFVVGTSSPRRIANLQHSLKAFLPHGKSLDYHISCQTLRGNVNSRIKKLKEGNYHAIVLALAGLERLTQTDKSAAELKELLSGLTYLILPQSTFPSAAAQGALGIEMRADRADEGKLQRLLSYLIHDNTVEEVSRERQAFKEFGGGCHLAVGIHVKKIGDHFLHVHSGEVDGKRVEAKWLEGNVLKPIDSSKKLFVGLPKSAGGEKKNIVYDEFLIKEAVALELELNHQHIFATSRYCLPTLKNSLNTQFGSLWAAGTKTAQQLTQAGLWVNGTCDSLGTLELQSFKQSATLQIMSPTINQEWITLTHPDSSSDLGQVIGTYQRTEQEVSAEYVQDLHSVAACYWTSFPQYLAFTSKFPFLAQADHYCGLGKTWQEFKNQNIKITTLASMQEFYGLAG